VYIVVTFTHALKYYKTKEKLRNKGKYDGNSTSRPTVSFNSNRPQVLACAATALDCHQQQEMQSGQEQ